MVKPASYREGHLGKIGERYQINIQTQMSKLNWQSYDKKRANKKPTKWESVHKTQQSKLKTEPTWTPRIEMRVDWKHSNNVWI